MIELHGWDNGIKNFIEARDATPIILNPKHIVSVSFDWPCEKVRVTCLSNTQFFVVEDLATVRAMLASPSIDGGGVHTVQAMLASPRMDGDERVYVERWPG